MRSQVCTIIFGFEFKESNSAKIIDLLLKDRIQAIVYVRALHEVRQYFRSRRNRNFAFLIETLIREHCEVIQPIEILGEKQEWKNKVKEKDLGHIATVKALNINHTSTPKALGFSRG